MQLRLKILHLFGIAAIGSGLILGGGLIAAEAEDAWRQAIQPPRYRVSSH